MKASQRGFTLIELLVVIAIMAILIALLLPAVPAIPGAGSGARCIVFAVRRRSIFVGFMSRLGDL